jgi:hypothetical protein
MDRIAINVALLIFAMGSTSFVAGCTSSDDRMAPPQQRVEGKVEFTSPYPADKDVTLTLNSVEAVVVRAQNGGSEYTFATALAAGDSYAVMAVPSAPGWTCMVEAVPTLSTDPASGTVRDADINIVWSCSPAVLPCSKRTTMPLDAEAVASKLVTMPDTMTPPAGTYGWLVAAMDSGSGQGAGDHFFIINAFSDGTSRKLCGSVYVSAASVMGFDTGCTALNCSAPLAVTGGYRIDFIATTSTIAQAGHDPIFNVNGTNPQPVFELWIDDIADSQHDFVPNSSGSLTGLTSSTFQLQPQP